MTFHFAIIQVQYPFRMDNIGNCRVGMYCTTWTNMLYSIWQNSIWKNGLNFFGRKNEECWIGKCSVFKSYLKDLGFWEDIPAEWSDCSNPMLVLLLIFFYSLFWIMGTFWFFFPEKLVKKLLLKRVLVWNHKLPGWSKYPFQSDRKTNFFFLYQ